MKTVIEMAAKAFETPGTETAFRNGFWTVTPEELERFTEFVRADEREACAKVCDDWYEKRGLYGVDKLAAAIRARSKT